MPSRSKDLGSEQGQNRRSRAAQNAVAEVVSRQALLNSSDVANTRCSRQMALPSILAPLEERVHLTATFEAYIAGAASGTHGTTFNATLFTTGGAATKWVVNWGDSSPSSTYYPSGGAPISASHSYSTPNEYRITATATPTTGSDVTASYALNSGFGSSGLVTDAPDSSGSSAGRAVAIDTSGGTYNGYIYVLSSYGSDAAVTRFKPNGTVDNAFGVSSTGTIVLTGMGSGTPTSIAVSGTGQYVAVAGAFSGWGGALIDTSANSVDWAKSDIVATGQANAVTFDNSSHGGPLLFLAGSVTGVSPHLSCMAVAELTLSSGSFATGFNSGCGPVAFAPSGCTCAYGTAILDLDDAGSSHEGLAIAGYTTYSGGSDFTLAEIDDTGAMITTFGSGSTGIVRANIGGTLGTGNGAVNNPSTDYVTGLAYDSSSDDLIVAGYTNATGGTGNHVALAAFGSGSGTLDSGFGVDTDGVCVGPAGVANSVVVTSAGKIVIAGTYNNDFLACQYTSAGLLDTNNFGTNGTFAVDFGSTSNNSTDAGYSIGIETDGSIIVCGSTTPSGGSYAQIGLADLLDNPSVTIS